LEKVGGIPERGDSAVPPTRLETVTE
jgi:hypothetical protein